MKDKQDPILKIKEINSSISDSEDANYSTLIEKYEADQKARQSEGKGVRLPLSSITVDEVESVKLKASKTEASSICEFEAKREQKLRSEGIIFHPTTRYIEEELQKSE